MTARAEIVRSIFVHSNIPKFAWKGIPVQYIDTDKLNETKFITQIRKTISDSMVDLRVLFNALLPKFLELTEAY